MNDAKLPYETPRIEDLGDLLELTAHNAVGAFTDASFPAHTPVTSITFST
jgi:hypothetical protein